ncbi:MULTISPECIES: ATP-binding protein [unclassified Fusibacter]|uniref:ATP-binding protein n=1 Tax=unclassified Fusibacter TaxID=2624464 RepID=UPI0013E95E03|nr:MULTISPECIES: ATP-binding protein [unclassified Fusibacter]MCK8060444.1 ATP-binding protein [Fusibacter sp. A2]NPE20267.1 HAMP domain-containing protein [Fusibacter sp. A1]
MKPIIDRFKKSLNLKLTAVTIVCVLLGLTTLIYFTQNNVRKLTEQSLTTMENEVNELVKEYYDNYIAEIGNNIEADMSAIMKENQILAQIAQTTFDYQEEFLVLADSLDNLSFFKDKMEYNGAWYQNSSDEPTTVFVPGLQVDEEGNMLDGVEQLVRQTMILDMVMPAFAEHGVNKLQVYYQGADTEGMFRLAPWSNIGENIFDLYPELNELPIWETFNPGLTEDYYEFAAKVKSEKGSFSELSKASSPVQDGLTGEIVLTFGTPLWSDEYKRFEGSFGYDVPITDIITRIEKIKLSDTGFAFLSQSNGNVFAINDVGARSLGIKGIEEGTQDAELGFNRLQRFITDSTFESVKTIPLNGDKTVFTEIEIDDKKYVVITRPLRAYQTWSTDLGFFDEYWTLGFAVPYDEVFKVYENVGTQINEDLRQSLVDEFVISALIIAIVIVLIVIMNSRLTKRLNILAASTESILDPDSSAKLEVTTTDEIGVLAASFNSMKDNVLEAHAEIKRLHEQERSTLEEKVIIKTKELEKVLYELNEREKLASLGSLVSGVSHEINTPLGTAITANSYLEDVNNKFHKKLSENKASRKDFDAYVENIDQSTKIIGHNLDRAAKLVKSFKEIAVHQSIEDRSEFGVCEYLNMIMVSLQHETKREKHQINIRCDQDDQVLSYPGAISQIVTNLVMNTLTHAYAPGTSGEINLSFEKQGNTGILKFSDDGKGIDAEHLSRIFEPFFTTNRKQGGSGLGLNIVYNIVTGLLKGKVTCDSVVGKGTLFTIEFPIND